MLKSPSPTYWAELKRTHLHTHSHTRTHPEPGRRRRMQSELQQQPRMARRAPAEMHKCSEPYETHGLSERLPRLARSRLPARPAASSPAPRPGWERQERGISPSLPTPFSLPARPLPSSLPTHPPTHSPAHGSRPHRHPQPPVRPVHARHPLAAAKGKPRRKGKSCSWN